MTNSRFLSVFAAALVLGGAWCEAARAQDQPAATRGTVKVRARVFNPFAIGQSRITLNPFGVFTVTDPSSIAAPAAASTVPTNLAASSGLVVDQAVTNDDVSTPSGIVVFAVRPPFRPPTRSPWRPPPRPPFLPP